MAKKKVTEFFCFIDYKYKTCVVKIKKEGSKWHEYPIAGDIPENFGSKTYMSYLTPKEILSWLRKDYSIVKIITSDEVDEFISEIEDDEDIDDCDIMDCDCCSGCD